MKIILLLSAINLKHLLAYHIKYGNKLPWSLYLHMTLTKPLFMHLIIYYTHYIIIVRMNYYQRVYFKGVQLTDTSHNSYQTFGPIKNIRQSNPFMLCGPIKKGSIYNFIHAIYSSPNHPNMKVLWPLFVKWLLTAKLLLALVGTVILGSEYQKTHDHILLSDGSGSLQTLLLAHLYKWNSWTTPQWSSATTVL
jgi:hypothetical protein